MRNRTLREILWVLGALSIGLALSVAYMLRSDGIHPDSYQYMRGGISLVSGQGYKSLSGENQLVQPPLYPALIGCANLLTGNPVTAGRYVSLAASLVSILLLYLLARIPFPGRPAMFAAYLLAFLPLRLELSTKVLSESTFCALVLCGLLLWVISESRPRAALLSGLSLGAAYLTRPEGFLVFFICTISLVASLVKREQSLSHVALRFAAIVVGFTIISSPYLVYLKKNTGHWSLSGKTEVNLAIAPGRTEGVPFAELRQLTDDDREIAVPRTATTYKGRAIHFAQNVRTELSMLGDEASLFLIACLGLALVAVAQSSRLRRHVIYTLAAVAGCLLFVLAVFFIEDRMLLAPIALLILLATPALSAAEAPPSRRERRSRLHSPHDEQPRAKSAASESRIARYLLTLALVYLALVSSVRIVRSRPTLSGTLAPLLAAVKHEQDARGPIIGNYSEPRALAFHTGRDCLILPWAPLQRVMRYADYHHASFLLLRDSDHPDLAALAQKPATTERLRPVARFQEGPHVLQLYRIGPVNEGTR